MDWVDFAPQAPKTVKVVHVEQAVLAPDDAPDAPLDHGFEENEAPQPSPQVLDPAGVPCQASKRRRLEEPPQPVENSAPAHHALPADAALAVAKSKAKAKSAPKVKAQPKPKAKAVPKVKAQAKAKGAAKAKAKAAPAPGAAAAAGPQYGCKKCYHKNGCKKCQNYRPGYPKPWRKGASKGAA